MPVRGQIWYVTEGLDEDAKIAFFNDDGSNHTVVMDNNPTIDLTRGFTEGVVLDTAAGLYFVLASGNEGLNAVLLVGRIGSATPPTIAFTFDPDDHLALSLSIDPINERLYVGFADLALTDTTQGIRQFTYNTTSGAVTDNGLIYDQTNASIDPSAAGATPIFIPRDMDIDAGRGFMYITQYTLGDGFETNALVRVNLGNLAAPAVSLVDPSLFPLDGDGSDFSTLNGIIIDVEVDTDSDRVYFVTNAEDVEEGGGGSADPEDGIWLVTGASIASNATPIKLTLSAGAFSASYITDNFYPGDMTLDEANNILYVESENSNAIGGGSSLDDVILKFQLAADGLSATLIGVIDPDFDQTANIEGMTFDQLAELGALTAVGAAAVEQAVSGTDLLAGAPTITDFEGDHLNNATVTVSGFAGSGDQLGIDSGMTTGAVAGTNITATLGAMDGSGNRTLTLSGYDTLANYQAVLDRVHFRSTGDNPTNYGANTTRTITWQVNDGAAGNPSGTLNVGPTNVRTTTLTVTAVNDAPVIAAPTTATVAEDATLAITGLSYTDPDANPATQDVKIALFSLDFLGDVTIRDDVAGGVTASDITYQTGSSGRFVTIVATQNQINTTFGAANGVTFKANADYNGDVTIRITGDDQGNTGIPGAVGADTKDITVTVTAVADITADTATTNEDTAVNVLVLANDTFEATDEAITGFTQGSKGTVTLNDNGTAGDTTDDFLVYTPNADFNGSDSFTYKVTSGGVDETATVNVTVNAVADIADDTKTVLEDAATTKIDVLANDTFEGVEAITFVSAGNKGGTITLNNNGTAGDTTDDFIDYTPAANFNGTETFTYKVTSGGVEETATVTVTVTPVDDPSVIISNGGGDKADVSVAENTTAVTSVVANDVDGGSIQYSIVGGADQMKFDIDAVTGALTFKAAPDFETPGDADANNTYVVIVQADQAGNGPDTQEITVTVTDVATTLTISPSNITQNEGDGAPTAYTYTVNRAGDMTGTVAVNYAVTGTSGSPADGTDFVGGTLPTGTVTLAQADGATKTFDINVAGDLKVEPDEEFTVTLNTPSKAVLGATIAATGVITNTDVNQPPTVTTTAGAASAPEQTLTVVDSGADLVDADSTLFYGVKIAISAAFDDGEDILDIAPGAPGAYGDLAGAYNNVTGVLTLTSVGGATEAQVEAVLRAVRFATQTDAPGLTPRTISFQVDDGNGFGPAGTRTVNVTAVNDEPVNTVPAGPITTYELQASAITGLSIADPDSPSGETYAVTLSTDHGNLTLTDETGLTVTGEGTHSVKLEGTLAAINAALGLADNVKYTPDAGYVGPDILTMLTSDGGAIGSGGPLTDQDTVAITVNDVNDPPAGTNGEITVIEDTPFTLTAAHFGFTDPADTPPDTLASVVIATLPAGGTGTLRLNGVAVTAGQEISVADIDLGLLVYTPPLNANGDDFASFTFQVRDNGGTGNGGVDLDPSANTLTIDITAVNDAPVVNLNAGGGAPTTTTATNATPVAVVDGGTVTSTIVISGAGSYLTDFNLRTFLKHTFAADLDVTITSPAGTVVTLTTDNGGGNDDVFNGTIWDDSANPGGQVPYVTNDGLVTDHAYVNLLTAANLTPEEPFGAFIGENPNGTWTITIVDDLANGDVGSLDSWTIEVETLPSAPTITAPTTFTQATPVGIPTGPAVVTSTMVVSGLGTSLQDVNLTTFLTHTFGADLDITLTSPAGTIVTITTDNGAGNDNTFNGTLWDDDANPAGQVPYATNNGVVTDHAYVNLTTATPMTPEEALAALIGEDPNGTWTITISDDLAGDGGSLDSWSLEFRTQTGGGGGGGFIEVSGPDTGANAVALSGPGTNLSDVDSATLANLKVSILASSVGAGDQLRFGATVIDITGTAATGEVTAGGTVFRYAISDAGGTRTITFQSLTGAGGATSPAVIADYELLLDGLRYNNSSDTPSGTRDFSVTVNDGALDSAPDIRSITLTGVNDAPAGTTGSVTFLEDTVYTVTAADFGFTDVDGDGFASVVIASLPGVGGLALNGVPVALNQEIALASINGGQLRYTPPLDARGPGVASFAFQVRDDGGTANGGIDLDPTPNTLTFNITPEQLPPSGTDTTISTPADLPRPLARVDFGFVDANTPADAFVSVIIVTLPAAGVLTLDGVAVSAGQEIPVSALDTGRLFYVPPAGAMGAGLASFTFQVRDAGPAGLNLDPTPNTITIDVGLAEANDPPVHTLPPPLVVPEDATVPVAGLFISDPDAGGAIVSTTFSVTRGVLSAGPATGVAIGGSGTSSLTLSGTLEAINAFLGANRLTYTPGAEYSGADVLTITTNDGGATGSGGARSTTSLLPIQVQPVNDAPVVGLPGGPTPLVDLQPTVVNGQLTVSDVDSPSLVSARVAITGGFVAGEDVLAFAGSAAAGPIVGSYDAASGVLTLTAAGGATLAQWQAALRSVTYDSTAPAPTGGDRTITFTASDGQAASAPVSQLIDVDGLSTLDLLKIAFEAILRQDPDGALNPPSAAEAAQLAGLAQQVDGQAISLEDAYEAIAGFADDTTSVATLSYQFFTGLTPTQGGYDFLVAGPANPSDLNDPYYAAFNLVNRYINFAVNLGAGGEGRPAFLAEYGSLTLAQATHKAYIEILGFDPGGAKIAEILGADVGGGMTRAQYLAAYGGDGPDGLGTKAAAVGFLLSVAVLENLGPYAQANDNFLADLADGDARFHIDLIETYLDPASPPGLVGMASGAGADAGVM